MKSEIVRLLFSCEDFISGEEISKKLNITRAAVWKHIKALKEDGCIIEAHTNKGYSLKETPDLLKPEYINKYLTNKDVCVKWKNETDSTNTLAKNAARKGEGSYTVYTAEHQTAGKGRIGRVWTSSFGEAIQFSIIFRPNIAPSQAPAINFAAALGVCSGIKIAYKQDLRIKWPNDVVYGSKKVCGILTEMSADMDRVEFIVCGVGINANQQSFPSDISDRATSIRQIVGEKIDRVRLAGIIIDEIVKYLDLYEKYGLEHILPQYIEHSAVIGKEITIKCPNEEIIGVCTGFGRNGEIEVTTDTGKAYYHAGDVSLRGVDGYV